MSLRKYAYIIIGAAVMSLSLNLFLIPARIAPGGISGIATVIGYFTKLPVGLMIFLINIPVFIWGFFEFDKKFLLNSLVGTGALSLFTELFSYFVLPITDNEVLQSVFGGALLGLGVAIVFMSGSTTGGTEIVAKILKKRFPYFSIGIFILIIDILVVIFATVLTGKWETFLYSGLALYISTKVIDGLIDGLNFAKMALIISDYPCEIEQEIYRLVERGTTEILAYSNFTKKDKRIVMCIVRPGEIVKIKEIVKKIDEKSFLIVADAREVLGQGFRSGDVT